MTHAEIIRIPPETTLKRIDSNDMICADNFVPSVAMGPQNSVTSTMIVSTNNDSLVPSVSPPNLYVYFITIMKYLHHPNTIRT
eukprot:14779763-Ditylum_brightwellii.AAC.1